MKWIVWVLSILISAEVFAQQSLGRNLELSFEEGILREKVVKPLLKQNKETQQKYRYCLESLKSKHCTPLSITESSSFAQSWIGQKIKVTGKLKEQYEVDEKTGLKLHSVFVLDVIDAQQVR
ncbi:hypothetical protein EXE10_02830 [Acinetobacter sp. WCHAc060033]|uniref:hypothetical protein n=1 Tax=Acinetobacter sp. WCHAc060033 TaxID=2518624 RepID=UPI001022D7EA|nr:hypothetical protein [Acinetobacter sp. WCHAc060033]RZG88479.1 hypothetical protein EXE10_02830 [Acinetobacter sp. WCHAc060033]